MRPSELLPVCLFTALLTQAPGQTNPGRERISSLIENLEEDDKRASAVQALDRIGLAGLRGVLDFGPMTSVSDAIPRIRTAADLIPYIDVTTQELEELLVPALLSLFPRSRGELREDLVFELWRTNMQMDRPNRASGRLRHDSSLEDLGRGLSDRQSLVRELAARLAGRRGAEAAPLLEQLLRRLGRFMYESGQGEMEVEIHQFPDLKRRSEEARSVAHAVLAISRSQADHVMAHMVLLQLGVDSERIAAAGELTRAGPQLVKRFREEGSEVVQVLTRALEDPHPRVVGESITALGIIGQHMEDWWTALDFASRCVPGLERLARHPDTQISERAKAALKQVQNR